MAQGFLLQVISPTTIPDITMIENIIMSSHAPQINVNGLIVVYLTKCRWLVSEGLKQVSTLENDTWLAICNILQEAKLLFPESLKW